MSAHWNMIYSPWIQEHCMYTGTIMLFLFALIYFFKFMPKSLDSPVDFDLGVLVQIRLQVTIFLHMPSLRDHDCPHILQVCFNMTAILLFKM